MLLLEDNYWPFASETGYENSSNDTSLCGGLYLDETHQYGHKHRDIIVTPTESTEEGCWIRFEVMMKFVAFLTILSSAAHAGLLGRSQTCPQVCVASHCPPTPQACYYGQVKDGCGCCVVCAAGEGEVCGERNGGSLSCGDGLRCDSVTGKLGGLPSSCVCTSSGPVCGSDGRTYPSICRLRAENRRAELGETPPVLLIQRGRCDSGELCD